VRLSALPRRRGGRFASLAEVTRNRVWRIRCRCARGSGSSEKAFDGQGWVVAWLSSRRPSRRTCGAWL